MRSFPGARIFAAAVGAVGAASAGCGSPPLATSSAAVTAEVRSARPPRYFPVAALTIDDDPAIVRFVAGGRRVEVVGPRVTVTDPERLERGGVFHPASGGEPSYVFWSTRELFQAPTFLGPLRRVAELDRAPIGLVPWLRGAALVSAGGVRTLDLASGATAELGVPAATRAIAASERFAVVQTAFGRARVTLDGGHHFEDATATFGGTEGLTARGGLIRAYSRGGGLRVLGSDGKPRDGFTRTTTEGAWTGDLLEAATRTGMLLDDGAVLIGCHGRIARLDPTATSVTSWCNKLPGAADESQCEPVRVGRDVLVACVSPARADIFEVEPTPRLERSFDLEGASAIDRFLAGGDDALAFLGPCDGRPVHVEETEVSTATGNVANGSPQRAGVICVRRSADDWIEHRLRPREAADLVAWAPRADGGAVAILASAPARSTRAEVERRGALRVLRVAAEQPPAFLTSNYERRDVVERSFRANADGTVEGWFPTTSAGMTFVGVSIDDAGEISAFAPPARLRSFEHAGPRGLGATEDGRLLETRDTGHHWTEVEPPPGSAYGPLTIEQCAPAGCSIGGFVRLGWGGPPLSSPAPETSQPGPWPRGKRSLRRAAPLVSLRCAPAGAIEGRRDPSAGFSNGPPPHPFADPKPIGDLGVFSETETTPTRADLAWIAPLAPPTVLRRSLAIAPFGSTPDAGWDLSLAPFLSTKGPRSAVGLLATGMSPTECGAPMLAAAGVTADLGGCVPGVTVGARVKDGVFALRVVDDAIELWRSEVRSGGSRSRPPADQAPRLVHRTEAGASLDGFSFGLGEQAGRLVAVALNTFGEAALAAVDTESGTFGEEDALAPLTRLLPGSDAACAPRSTDATVLLPSSGLMGVELDGVPLVRPSTGTGLALIRWSRGRACLDAMDLPVVDLRLSLELDGDDGAMAPRRIYARFAPSKEALVFSVQAGEETRQKLTCDRIAPGLAP